MNKCASRRLVSILLLGFSSGLPLALTGATLQAWFASAHVAITTIGLLTLTGQPYVYKFFWSPLLDYLTPPWLGRRRGWIVGMQFLLAITLLGMSLGDPLASPWILAILAFLLALFSATQDIGIDAYRTDLLLPEERGLGAAFYVTAYRIAMIISGGLALILAQYVGWRITYASMAGLMLVNLLLTVWGSIEPPSFSQPLRLRESVIAPLANFLQRAHAGWILLFIVLYKVGDAFTVSLSTAFLIQNLHFSLAVIGMVNKIIGLIAAILGGMLGGVILLRWTVYSGLMLFGWGQALCSFLFMALALVGKNLGLLMGVVFADNFFSGMTSAALIAFLTSLCDKRFSATQFALFSAVMAIGRVFIGPVAGITAVQIGWPLFFLLSFFLSLPGLGLLWRLRYRYDVVF